MLPTTKASLLDFPEQMQTARLLIRPLRPGDGAIVHPSAVESFDELHPWIRWARTQQTPETEAVVRLLASRFIMREELSYIVFRKPDGEHIGNVGVHHIDWEVPKFEIGYWARTSMSGQGYITEAVNRLTDFLFDSFDARRIEIRCDSRNTRSDAVAERAGYRLEATLHHDTRGNDGRLRDTLVFVRTKDD